MLPFKCRSFLATPPVSNSSSFGFLRSPTVTPTPSQMSFTDFHLDGSHRLGSFLEVFSNDSGTFPCLSEIFSVLSGPVLCLFSNIARLCSPVAANRSDVSRLWSTRSCTPTLSTFSNRRGMFK
uniref:Uncharacterized protein n=1 Tax=Cacopsylla melanoneura TaxID=428564 RepID=A0A8D8Z0Q8_9HEMI